MVLSHGFQPQVFRWKAMEFSKLREEERLLPGDGLLLNDCYNANPMSMRAALLHLSERAAGRRRVAVLGEMSELGPEAGSYHAEVRDLRRQREVGGGVGTPHVARVAACPKRQHSENRDDRAHVHGRPRSKRGRFGVPQPVQRS